MHLQSQRIQAQFIIENLNWSITFIPASVCHQYDGDNLHMSHIVSFFWDKTDNISYTTLVIDNSMNDQGTKVLILTTPFWHHIMTR